MTDIAARELRNDVSGVLRRVEAGQRLRITVSGRSVAELVPPVGKPSSQPWQEFMRGWEHWRADAGLAGELRTLLPDTTDDDLIQ